MKVKGLEFSILRYGYIYNDLAWNVALPNPASQSDPAPKATMGKFPCTVVLIKHPDAGYLLYDVGDYPQELDSAPRPTHWDEFFWQDTKREDYLDEHLKKGGLTLDDIDGIILSHMHCDHANGIKFFPGKKAADNVWVSGADFKHACAVTLQQDNERDTSSAYWRSIVTTPGIAYHYIDEDQELFPGVHLVLLKGHTPGTLGLLLELEGGNYLFPSDACGSRLNYGPPARMPGIVYDTLGYGECVEKLYKLQKQYDATLVFSHDLAADEECRHYPEFYK